jgi:pimeloyl-ACP methyl ester carboxylesterase
MLQFLADTGLEPKSTGANCRDACSSRVSACASRSATFASSLDLRDQLGRIRVPTFIVAGEDDPEMTLAGAEEAAAAMRPEFVRFKSYPKARHAVFRDVSAAYHDVLAFVLEGDEVSA